MESERQIEDFSLDVLRNFSIMSLVGLAVSTQAQTLTSSGDKRGFQIAYGVLGTVIASIVQVIALLYVIGRESYNRRATTKRTGTDAGGATVPAMFISAALWFWYGCFLVFFYSLQLDA